MKLHVYNVRWAAHPPRAQTEYETPVLAETRSQAIRQLRIEQAPIKTRILGATLIK